jgi:DNA-binding GntR family transcriptional regulator
MIPLDPLPNQTTPLAQLIAFDVDFHRAIYRLSGNPAIEEMIAPPRKPRRLRIRRAPDE